MNVDPYRQHFSPYLSMGNNPISRVDPDGGDDLTKDAATLALADQYAVMPDNPTPFQVGVEWMTGIEPRDRWFTSGDQFTEMLKSHAHIQDTRQQIAQGLAGCGYEQGCYDSNPYSLSGIEGVPKYLKDYSTLATGGLTGNLAVTYLGSYNLKYTITNVNVENRTATVAFSVHNRSSIQSALRPPVLGYTKWWSDNVGNSLNQALQSGPMSTTTQTFEWTETIGF